MGKTEIQSGASPDEKMKSLIDQIKKIEDHEAVVNNKRKMFFILPIDTNLLMHDGPGFSLQQIEDGIRAGKFILLILRSVETELADIFGRNHPDAEKAEYGMERLKRLMSLGSYISIDAGPYADEFFEVVCKHITVPTKFVGRDRDLLRKLDSMKRKDIYVDKMTNNGRMATFDRFYKPEFKSKMVEVEENEGLPFEPEIESKIVEIEKHKQIIEHRCLVEIKEENKRNQAWDGMSISQRVMICTSSLEMCLIAERLSMDAKEDIMKEIDVFETWLRLRRQCTDLRFDYMRGYIPEDDYKAKEGELDTQLEDLDKQVRCWGILEGHEFY